jgi:hypothetical protein
VPTSMHIVNPRIPCSIGAHAKWAGDAPSMHGVSIPATW